MGTSGSAPDVTREDALGVFSGLAEPHTPLTTGDVARTLECSEQSAERRLRALADDGAVRTRQVGDGLRVWWRPADADRATGRRSTLAEFGAFVRAVEDYAIFTLDADGTVASWNAGAERIKGYAADEIVGRHFSAFYTDEDVAAGVPETNLERAAEQGQVEAEGWRVRADGSQFWADVVLTAIRDDDDELVGFTKVTRDRTAEREYERQLRRERDLERTERRFEAIFEDPNILVGLLDTDGTVLDVNETAMGYVDADRDDVTGQPFWETPWWGADEDVRDDVREWTERAAGGEYVNFQADLTRPDGERYTLEGAFRPVTDDDGDVVSVVVSDRDVTERTEHERQLERSERRYRTLVENFPNGAVALVDRDLRYQTVGGSPVDVAGLTIDEVEGGDVGDVLSDELASALVPRYEAALRGEHGEFELEVGDHVYQFQVVPVRDAAGDIFAALGMSQDVTDQKRRERELTKYETIVETVNDGIYVKDDDGYFTMVNDAYAELTGYDREELVGAHSSLVVDEAAIDQSRKMEAAMERGDNPTMEATIETADGEEVPAEATFTRFETGDGEQNHVGVVRDISDRLAQRRRLEESERRHRTLVENFPDGAVGLFDENLEYTAIGGQLLDATGVDREERVGSTVSDVYPDDIVEAVEPYFEAALDGESNSFETEFHDRHLLAHTLPVTNGDDEVFAGMLVVQDVTERKRRERRLEELIDRLEASNERLEQFAYAASHDLQEPLRMVSSYLRLIEQRYADELDDDGEEFIEYAVDGADRMRDMIEGLLQYSRVDTRGDPFGPVDLNAVLADVCDDLQVRIDEADADIDAEDLPVVEGDRGQLRQLFQNLLDNAIEYSGDGPPEIRLRAERRGVHEGETSGGSSNEWTEADGDWWEISVTDQGIGIDPADADRVFEVFQRLHAPGDHSGTGIGLALCERIVERHGGDVWVDSEPGEGATFTFTLPAAGERDD